MSSSSTSKRLQRATNEQMMVDQERDDILIPIEETATLVQMTTPLTIVNYAAETISLTELMHIFMNMRDLNVMRNYPLIHERLRQNTTLGERKRLITILNSLENYSIGSMPHFLGCMTSDQSSFVLENGKKTSLARLIHWLCDNNLAAHARDKVILKQAQIKLGEACTVGLRELGNNFAHQSVCQNSVCINPVHYVRILKKDLKVADTDMEEIFPTKLIDAQLGAEIQAFNNVCDSKSWLRDEFEKSNGGYVFSPLESLLADDTFNAFGELTLGSKPSSACASSASSSADSERRRWKKASSKSRSVSASSRSVADDLETH